LVLYEVLTGSPPWSDDGRVPVAKILKKIVRKNLRPTIPERFPASLRALLTR
jgi:hypothetical protein